MKKPERLEGRRVDLVQVGPQFFQKIVEWRNDPDNRRHFFSHATLSLESQRRWYEAYQQDDSDLTFVIQLKTWTRDGMVRIYHLEAEARTGEFGRLLLGEKGYQGKSLAEEACRLLLDHGIRELGLREVDLEVYDSNTAAIGLYSRLGFETAGFGLRKDGSGAEQRTRKMLLRAS